MKDGIFFRAVLDGSPWFAHLYPPGRFRPIRRDGKEENGIRSDSKIASMESTAVGWARCHPVTTAISSHHDGSFITGRVKLFQYIAYSSTKQNSTS